MYLGADDRLDQAVAQGSRAPSGITLRLRPPKFTPYLPLPGPASPTVCEFLLEPFLNVSFVCKSSFPGTVAQRTQSRAIRCVKSTFLLRQSGVLNKSFSNLSQVLCSASSCPLCAHFPNVRKLLLNQRFSFFRKVVKLKLQMYTSILSHILTKD